MRLLVISANQRSIWFTQDELVGVKCGGIGELRRQSNGGRQTVFTPKYLSRRVVQKAPVSHSKTLAFSNSNPAMADWSIADRI